jgi:hypothetical protein
VRHAGVPVVQLVGSGEALLRAAHPADRQPLELVVLRLVGLDAAARDGALGGENVGLVPAGFQLSRQPQRHDLDAGAVVGEELVGGEEDLHCRGPPGRSSRVFEGFSRGFISGGVRIGRMIIRL